MVSGLGPSDFSRMINLPNEPGGVQAPKEEAYLASEEMKRGLAALFAWDVLLTDGGERPRIVGAFPHLPTIPSPDVALDEPGVGAPQDEGVSLLSMLERIGTAIEDSEELQREIREKMEADNSSLLGLYDSLFSGAAQEMTERIEQLNDLNDQISAIDERGHKGARQLLALRKEKKKLRKEIKEAFKEMGINVKSGKKLTRLLKKYNKMGISPENAFLMIASLASTNKDGELVIKDLKHMNNIAKKVLNSIEKSPEEEREAALSRAGVVLFTASRLLAGDNLDKTEKQARRDFLNVATDLSATVEGYEDYFVTFESFLEKGEDDDDSVMNSPFFYVVMMNFLTELDNEATAGLPVEEKLPLLFALLEEETVNVNGVSV